MYTQCPDCSTAFRVTADVLKQAAGKVRCGGCGNAFNALKYLTERMPEPTAPKAAEGSLPELKPESPKQDDGLPTSISAEQSAALLKTLDQLAGSDIRIEDTGVEWRVFDEDETSEPAADDDHANIADAPETAVDELLEESPTPVDQILTAAPTNVEAGEIFEESAQSPTRTSVDEIRFDDNTPLPDDFGLDGGVSIETDGDIPERPQPEAEPADVTDDAQAELALSEPDEWEDILGEFEDLAVDVAAPADDTAAAIQQSPDEPAELQDSPGEPAPQPEPETPEQEARDEVEELLDMDTQFALQAEAMGIDLSGMHERAEAADEADTPEAAVIGADAAPAEEPKLELHAEPDEEPGPDPDTDIEEVSAAEPSAPEPAADPEDDIALDLEAELGAESLDELAEIDLIDEADAASIENELAELADRSNVFDDGFFDAEEAAAQDDVDLDIELPDADESGAADEDGHEIEVWDVPQADARKDDDFDFGLLGADEDAPSDKDDGDAEMVDADEIEAAYEDGDEDEDSHIPPLSEEEQTINMMIDQDLLSLAIEDEDGFASTIVIPREDADADAIAAEDEWPSLRDTASGFETIVMEGETIHSEIDKEKLEADAAAAAALAKQRELIADQQQPARSRGIRYGMLGAVFLLVILLLAQAVHQYREELATIPAFNSTVGPMYRAIGKPLSPAWDIRGWRFEATRGSTDENDETLTIYSRIGNKSETPLPYPMISISLTDRFEETIGSRMLDPAEYLTSDLDPRKLVQPGNTFNAVISIQSPSEEATGFKLNVCYRLSSGQLRCAIEDFK